jgi:hypothetical protein
MNILLFLYCRPEVSLKLNLRGSPSLNAVAQQSIHLRGLHDSEYTPHDPRVLVQTNPCAFGSEEV